MKEIWKSIHPDYLVSNLGNVKSLKNDKETLLKNGVDKDGYNNVRIDRRLCKTHRLIATAFIPNPDNKPLINHKDGNKQNNRVSNLEWCTAKENAEHALRIGLLRQGKQNPHSGLNPIVAETIRQLKSKGASTKELATKYQVSKTAILRIVRNQTWKQSA